MSEPFLSEIKVVSFNFPPKGWALCNGQLLPINQNQALFSLLGTTYGGNGQTNFALPNLRGRVPIHFGGAHDLGEAAGTTSVTINIQQTMPTHTHHLMARTDSVDRGRSDRRTRAGKLFARAQVSLQGGNKVARVSIYGNPSSLVDAATPARCQQRRRQPAAQQHDALSDAELHHRAAGHLPLAN